MMQAQNAALFLGQIPNPRSNPRGRQPEVNLPLAKMFNCKEIAFAPATPETVGTGMGVWE